MDNLYIFGTSTTARSILKFVNDYHLFNVKGFIVDAKYKTTDSYYNYPAFTLETLPEDFNKEKDFLFVAIQWNRLNKDRKDIFERLKNEGYNLANIISPNSILHSELKGTNCWISDKVVIENDVVIKDNVYVKTGATVGHLSIVESHAFIGAHSLIGGNCHIGNQSYIGISSTVFNSVNIGQKCLVGACVFVKRHLPDFSVIKTKNDDFIIKQYPEDIIESKLLASIKIR